MEHNSSRVLNKNILTTIPDVNREILLELDDETLDIMCTTCKEAHDVCKDDLFWRERIIRKFNINLTKYKDDSASYRDMYTFLLKYNELIRDRLYFAMREGCLPIFRYLMEDETEELLTVKDKETLIRKALAANSLNIILYIVETYLKCDFDKYLFCIAILCNNIEVFKCLIDRGIIGSDRILRLFHALAGKGDVETLTYICTTFKPSSEEIDSALSSATSHGVFSTMKYLVKIDGDANKALNYAVRDGYLTGIKYLIEEAGASADSINTALVIAAAIGNLIIVKYLIIKGADKRSYNNGALLFAEEGGKTDVIEYLRGLE